MDLKVGDQIKLNLAQHIKNNKKSHKSLLDFWKAIDGRCGTIVDIVGDDEIWVKGKSGMVRMFTAATLVKV